MEEKNNISELASEARRYADLQIDELKLKATEGLSAAMGRIVSTLLIVAVLAIVLGLLAYALVQWLNIAIGSPWGTLAVAGLFGILLAVLFLRKDKMFRDPFVKLFIGIFYGSGK